MMAFWGARFYNVVAISPFLAVLDPMSFGLVLCFNLVLLQCFIEIY